MSTCMGGEIMIIDKLHNTKKHTIHLCSCDKCGTLFTSYKDSHNKELCKHCKSRDIIGKKINRLTVLDIEYRTSPNGKTIRKYAKCKCDCGEICYIRHDCLGKNTQSCGCLTHEKRFTPNRRHPLYRIYYGMKQRCYNKHDKAHKYYGAMGIKICKEWLDDYENFYNWSIDNGYKKGLTIDRIDCNGNYEPSNCRWVTSRVQSYNNRRNILLFYKEKWRTIEEIANIDGITWNSAYYKYVTKEKTRLHKKWLYGTIKGGGKI